MASPTPTIDLNANTIEKVRRNFQILMKFYVGAATTTRPGTVTAAAAVPDSTATDVPTLVADFNTLLAHLRTAGILHP